MDPTVPSELATIYFGYEPESRVFENGLVTVAYELEDTVCNGGGIWLFGGIS